MTLENLTVSERNQTLKVTYKIIPLNETPRISIYIKTKSRLGFMNVWAEGRMENDYLRDLRFLLG